MKKENQNHCKKMLANYWQGAYSLHNEQVNSNNSSKASKAKRKIDNLRSVGHCFISYLLSDTLEESIVDKIQKVFSQTCQNKGVDTMYLLGYAIKQEINKSILSVVSDKLSQIVSSNHSSKELSHISIDSSDDDSSVSASNISNVYAKSKDQNEAKDHDLDDIIIPGIEDNSANFNNDDIPNENQQVLDYLYKLSKSTTQLSYLSQIMKLQTLEFEEGISKFNNALFSCQAKIFIRSRAEGKERQTGRQFTGECPGASSKKQAKRIASLFLLRKIYNRIPDIWIKFKQYRQQHPQIQQPLNINNQQIFKKLKLYKIDKLTVFQNKINEDQKNKKTINQYLTTVKSFKAQMNLLLGKYKKISNLQFIRDKQDQMSLWPVSASVYDSDKKFNASSKQTSKKVAEQNCCKALLIQLYMQDPRRWQQFAQYKKQKALST